MQRINLKFTGVFIVSLALVSSVWFGLNLREMRLRAVEGKGQIMTKAYQSSDQRRAQFKRFEKDMGKHSTIEGVRTKLGTRFANVKLPKMDKLHGKSPKIAALTKNLIGVYLIPEDENTATVNEIVVYFAPEKSQKDRVEGIDPRATVAFTVQSSERPDFAGSVDRNY